MNQIWTFNLVYICGLVFLLNDLTYNVFSYILYIVYLISCIYGNDVWAYGHGHMGI
jgi:hypothetical protein